jgi:hypothetical protein
MYVCMHCLNILRSTTLDAIQPPRILFKAAGAQVANDVTGVQAAALADRAWAAAVRAELQASLKVWLLVWCLVRPGLVGCGSVWRAEPIVVARAFLCVHMPHFAR